MLPPAQGEAEQLVRAALEGLDDLLGEGPGQVVDDDQLSVHGRRLRRYTAERRGRRQRLLPDHGRGWRWVRASARRGGRGHRRRAGMGCSALRSGRAVLGAGRGRRPGPSTVRAELASLRPRRWPSVAARRHARRISTWRASLRWTWVGAAGASWAASQPPSSWRGPSLPVTSTRSTAASQGRRFAAVEQAGQQLPPRCAAGSTTGRRRCAAGPAPAGRAAGRCRPRPGCR